VNNEAISSNISANDIRFLFGNVEDVYNFNRLELHVMFIISIMFSFLLFVGMRV